MKARFVAELIRLYPAQWRAEYAEGLAEVLVKRPLGAKEVLNVFVNAIWQQLRLQEPWLIAGAPVLLWDFVFWMTLLFAPAYAVHMGGKPTWVGMILFFGIGFWTVVRHGDDGGRAAMKLAMLLTLPPLTAALLVLVQALRVVTEPGGGGGFRFGASLAGTLETQWRGDVVRLLVAQPILMIPCMGLVGWLGGRAGHVVQRIRRQPQV